MSTTSSGSSRLMARPRASPFSARPGPLVVVTPRWPPNAAPIADAMAAISSSAWNVRTPNDLCFDSSWRMSDAGVIGYEPRKIGSPLCWPAATRPQASAVLPVMFVYVPGSSRAGATS
jgi:hypothetical protein